MDQERAHRFRFVFLDAEGTLYVPKHGKMAWEFWTNPSPEAAVDFFELDVGVREALEILRRQADTLCVVSRNPEEILLALLDRFGIRSYFDAIMLNGDKGDHILEFLAKRGLSRRNALMVGDLPRLDLYPARRAGVEAILIDRFYNQGVDAERIKGIRELPTWLKIADLAEDVGSGRPYVASLDDFQTAAEIENERLVGARSTKSLIATSS